MIDLIKMLIFHTTLQKRLGRKLPSKLERMKVTGKDNSSFLKNYFKKTIFKISIDSNANILVNECQMYLVQKWLISQLPFSCHYILPSFLYYFVYLCAQNVTHDSVLLQCHWFICLLLMLPVNGKWRDTAIIIISPMTESDHRAAAQVNT